MRGPPAERGALSAPRSWIPPTAAAAAAAAASARFLAFGRRGGTRRLKLATTSGEECRFRVGWAASLDQKGMVGGQGPRV